MKLNMYFSPCLSLLLDWSSLQAGVLFLLLAVVYLAPPHPGTQYPGVCSLSKWAMSQIFLKKTFRPQCIISSIPIDLSMSVL